MFNMKKRLAVALAAFGVASSVLGAVLAEEAGQLGTTLTPLGAEKAGNADGSIPAYAGAPVTPPASYKPGSGKYPDPFADDKELVKIDSKNVAQYKDVLTPGVVATLQQYPSFAVHVYPTRRTAQYPKWVLDNSIKNATKGELGGEVRGDAVKGVYGGIPFPIPKSGEEVLWNFRLRYVPAFSQMRQSSYLVDSSGRSVFLGRFLCRFANAYYDPVVASWADPEFFKHRC